MRVWRISRSEYSAFDGEGGRLASARWHRRGVRVVYTSESLALAALEFFVHVSPSLELKRLVAVSADIPSGLHIETIDRSKLTAQGREAQHIERLRDLGMEWLHGGRAAILSVPSAVIPVENNYLLNPLHPDAAKIQVNPPERFEFDYRLWKSASKR